MQRPQGQVEVGRGTGGRHHRHQPDRRHTCWKVAAAVDYRQRAFGCETGEIFRKADSVGGWRAIAQSLHQADSFRQATASGQGLDIPSGFVAESLFRSPRGRRTSVE